METEQNSIQTIYWSLFWKRGSISRLFQLVDATFDKLSFELWFIYHENPTNPNVFLQYYVEDIGQQYDTVFNAIMTSIDKEITRDQEEKVHKTTSLAFGELEDKIHKLCLEMSVSIRKENVGHMRRGGKKDKSIQREPSSESVESGW